MVRLCTTHYSRNYTKVSCVSFLDTVKVTEMKVTQNHENSATYTLEPESFASCSSDTI